MRYSLGYSFLELCLWANLLEGARDVCCVPLFSFRFVAADTMSAIFGLFLRKTGIMQIRELKDENGNVIHACAVASFPLPNDHWVYQEPNQPVAIGSVNSEELKELRARIREALMYTIQVCTSNGKDFDFDPDAMLLTIDNVLFFRKSIAVSGE